MNLRKYWWKICQSFKCYKGTYIDQTNINKNLQLIIDIIVLKWN